MNFYELEEKALKSIRPMSARERRFYLELAELEAEAATALAPSSLRRRIASILVGVGRWIDPEVAPSRLVERQA